MGLKKNNPGCGCCGDNTCDDCSGVTTIDLSFSAWTDSTCGDCDLMTGSYTLTKTAGCQWQYNSESGPQICTFYDGTGFRITFFPQPVGGTTTTAGYNLSFRWWNTSVMGFQTLTFNSYVDQFFPTLTNISHDIDVQDWFDANCGDELTLSTTKTVIGPNGACTFSSGYDFTLTP